jgi:hypothetical protein
MLQPDFIRSLKPGQRVLLGNANIGFGIVWREAEVTTITSTGIIKIVWDRTTYSFNKRGEFRGKPVPLVKPFDQSVLDEQDRNGVNLRMVKK